MMGFMNMLILFMWTCCVWLLGAITQQRMNTDEKFENANPAPDGVRSMLYPMCLIGGIYLMFVIATS